MVLTFKSSVPEVFTLMRTDADGAKTVATATKTENQGQWRLTLSHPSQSWSRDFYGPNVLGGLSDFFVSKENDFRDARARGHRPRPEPIDRSQRFDEVGNPAASPITMSQRDSRYRGR